MALKEVLAQYEIKVNRSQLDAAISAMHGLDKLLTRMDAKLSKSLAGMAKLTTDPGVAAAAKAQSAAELARAKASLAAARAAQINAAVSARASKLDIIQARTANAVARAELEKAKASTIAASTARESARASGVAAKADLERARAATLAQRALNRKSQAEAKDTEATRKNNEEHINGQAKFGGALNDIAKIRRVYGLLQFGAMAIGMNQFVSSTLLAADAVGKMSVRLGFTNKEIQVMSLFAEEAGTDMMSMERAFKAVSRAAYDAQKGSKDLTEAFSKLGINVEDTNGKLKETLPLFFEIGNALRGMEDVTARNAIAQKLLGEEGLKLIPGFKSTTHSIEEQMRALEDLAVMYDDEFIANVELANDQMTRMRRAMERTKVSILTQIMPALLAMTDRLRKAFDWMTKMIKGTQTFNTILTQVAIWGIMKAVAAMGGFVKIIRIANSLLWRFLIPFFILEDIWTFLTGGDSVTGTLLNKLFGEDPERGKKIAEDLKKAIEDVWAAASAAGGVVLAFLEGDEAKLKQQMERLSKSMDVLGDRGKAALDLVGEHLPIVLGAMDRVLKAWVARMSEEAVATLFTVLTAAAGLLVAAVIGPMAGAFVAAVGFAAMLIAYLMNIDWAAVWEGIKTWFFDTIEACKPAIKEFGSYLKDLVSQAIQGIGETWSTVWGWMGDLAKSIIDTTMRRIEGAIWAFKKLGSLVGLADDPGSAPSQEPPDPRAPGDDSPGFNMIDAIADGVTGRDSQSERNAAGRLDAKIQGHQSVNDGKTPYESRQAKGWPEHITSVPRAEGDLRQTNKTVNINAKTEITANVESGQGTAGAVRNLEKRISKTQQEGMAAIAAGAAL